MDKYKLKFENGRNCTIECDSTKSFQDKINDAEIRFNSECVEINDKPIKKHSLGGFLVGATIGAILGNSVPKKTISKTASGVKRTAKNVTRNVKKQVKKFSGGGGVEKNYQIQIFWTGLSGDERFAGEYIVSEKTLDNLEEQYGHAFSIDVMDESKKEAISWFELKKILWQKGRDKGFFAEGGTTEDERYCRLAEDTGKGVNEGYVVGWEETIYEKKSNLVKHLRSLDYEDADGNSTKKIKNTEDLLEYFYNDEYYYWTEWDCDAEIEEQGYYYTRDGKEVEIASKGKKIDPTKAPRWWNKQVREYEFFVFNTETNKVWAGNEYQNDAKDELKEFLLDAPTLPLKVLSKRAITNKKINPLAYENWARSSEVIETIQQTFRNPEQMARGSKVKTKNNTQAIKGLVKDLENTPYSIGLAILRERLLTYSENDLRSLEKNPDAWKNPIISLGMYKDYYSRVAQELSFDSGKNNTKAVKGLVKDLENTPYSIGLAILRERLLTYAENDLKAMEKNPDNWSNAFISLGMYKDYANRVIDNLKFEYATGGDISSVAMAGAVPELAIADEVSKRLPATTSAIDRRLAERIYSEKPKWYEDRGMQYAGGGKVGDEITFKHWSGDIKTGTIKEDLGDGNFDVSSGWGSVLVNKDDIISGGSKFSGGGLPNNNWKVKSYESADGDIYYVKNGKKIYRQGDIKITSIDQAEKLAKELNNDLSTNKSVTFYLKKSILNDYGGDEFYYIDMLFDGYKKKKILPNQYIVYDLETPIAEHLGNIKRYIQTYEINNETNKFSGGGSTPDEFENKTFWVSSRATKGKYQVMRGDYMTKYIYENKSEADAKARMLNSKRIGN